MRRDHGGAKVFDDDELAEERNWILKTAARLVPEHSTGWHRYVMPLGVLTLLITWIMLGELDSLLKGMQGADGASHGMSALTTGSPDQKTEALVTWAKWDRCTRSFPAIMGLRSLAEWLQEKAVRLLVRSSESDWLEFKHNNNDVTVKLQR